MGKKRDKNFRKIVQGEWTLGHTDEELRENVFVGNTPLKDCTEEQLAVIWEGKIGTHHFRQAVRREVVYRISAYFKTGYEKLQQIRKKKPLAEAISFSTKKDS